MQLSKMQSTDHQQGTAQLKVSILPEKGVLRAVARGEFSLRDAENCYLQILNAALEVSSDKILVDGREVTGEPEVMERFLYGEFAADKCQSLLYRRGRFPMFAFVLKEPVLDPRRLGETVARNRGMVVKAFDNLEDAEDWLGLPIAGSSINAEGDG